MSTYEGFVIPSTPADQLRLSQMINEVVNSMTRSKAETDHKKEVINAIAEEFNIPKAVITSAAKIMYNENLNEVKAKHDDLEQLVNVIVSARSKSRIQRVATADTDNDDADDAAPDDEAE